MADKYQETMNPMLASVMQKYQAMANSTALNQTYKKTIGQFVNRLVSDNSEEKLSGPSAMRKAIRELTEQGISTIDHASGRTVRMDTMVRNSLMTEFTGIVQGVQRQLAEDIGADGVEISAHQHSAEDHEPIQGHTFANDEFEKLQNGDIAEDIEGEQFQTDRPIGMWNCRHMAFPVLIGISEPSFSPEELDAIKARNEEGIEFHGEHMTLYEAEQAQRKLETGMRRERENLNLLKEVRDTDPMLEHDYQKSKAQLAELRDEYKALGDVLAPKAIRMKMERSYVPRGSTGSKILKSLKSLVSKTIGMMPRNIQKGAE
ncbi:MAG: phage minor capsid protein, partial [Treponema sp.]|nr:phage minor capsid protein [Treponema sp.]